MADRSFSRRKVLVSGAAAAAGAATFTNAAPLFAAASANEAELGLSPDRSLPAMFKLSLAGYSFRKSLDLLGVPGQMSLFDLADLAARLGLPAVEPTSYYFLREDDAFVYALKRHIFKLGLEVSGMPINNKFTVPPGAEREKQLAHVRHWTDICAKLGSPTMRVFAGYPPEGFSTDREETFPYAVDCFKQACDYAATKGVFLALENHGYLTETADDIIRLIKAVDHPWFGVNLDTGNFHGNPYENIAKTAPHAIVCQIKTQVRKGEKRVQADYDRIFQILRDARYRGYVALEYEAENPKANVPDEIDQLRAAIRRVMPQGVRT
jgi:sugar phosphate isomerase/epimerase